MFPKIVVFSPISWNSIGFTIINHPFWGTLIFSWESKGTPPMPPPQEIAGLIKGLWSPPLSLNAKALIRPYFLGGWHRGAPLDSHDSWKHPSSSKLLPTHTPPLNTHQGALRVEHQNNPPRRHSRKRAIVNLHRQNAGVPPWNQQFCV